jgi:uncharacterized phiE125 gp8 family phage protein
MVTDKKVSSVGCGVVTLEDAKAYLRVSNNVEDATIERMVSSAIEWAESYTGVSFREKELEVLFTQLNGQLEVTLPESPVGEIESVEVAHKDGTYSETTYEAFGINEKTITFPTVYSSRGVAGFRVKYAVGKNDSNVAQDAILRMVSEMYAVRGMTVEGSVSEPTQLSVMKMLHPLKKRVVLW